MTVLLVDDQVSILSGLIAGIDWEALRVTSIRTATNAQKAKKIMESEPVDILLCDIEMPGENGLSLLRWARNRGMDFICIFLTSHADFLYAKEAIQLDCFDYILQPALYSEIQGTIAKAVKRMQDSREKKKLEQYGVLTLKYAAGPFQNLFSDWTAGKPLSVSSLCQAVAQMGKSLTPESQCFVVWGHLLNWHTEPWQMQEWAYALDNVINEVYKPADYGVLSFQIDNTSLGWFIYAPVGQFAESAQMPLSEVYPTVAEQFPCDFAFYQTPVVPLKEIDAQFPALARVKQNNIFREPGIFCLSDYSRRVRRIRFLDVMQVRHWESLLADGRGETVAGEACCYLDSLAETGDLDWNDLFSFWIQFQQAVLSAARARSCGSQELFSKLEAGSRLHSLDETKQAVRETVKGFAAGERPEENAKKLIEKIKGYVEDHLEKPLNVGDIATGLFMNSDYISRIFKNECQISLKEYIVQRKMQSAQVLLKTTSLPVNIVAVKLGYNNFSHFSQVYHKTIGVTPSEERKGRDD